jgi:hypothetical protein
MAWNTDSNANRLIKSYVQDFIDISGSLILRDKSNLYVNGSTTINGNLFLNNTSMLTDLSCNKRIFVGGDCSINGNLTSLGDISINGMVTSCLFKNSSIPQTAFAGPISVPGPDYTKPSVVYEQKFKANADISLNGNVAQVNRININGNIKLSDATLMNKYDDNMSKIIDVSSAYVSSVCFTKPSGFTTDGDSFIVRTSTSGKIIAMAAGGTNYGYTERLINANDPISNWSNYSKFGVYITRDFGNTWTKYLVPYEDGTKLGYCYQDMDMSSDGKHIIIAVLPGGNNPNGLPSTIAFSHDYGYTWSSTRFPMYTGGSGTNYAPRWCCISDDGKKMIASNGGEANFWYTSNEYGLSWDTRPVGYYGGLAAIMGLACNKDITRLVGFLNRIVTVCTLDNSLNYISSVQYNVESQRGPVPGRPGNVILYASYSRDLRNMHFMRYVEPQRTYIELYDAIADTWRSVTPNLSQVTANTAVDVAVPWFRHSSVISTSGKYIFASLFSTPSIASLGILSSDYGNTFNGFQTPAGFGIRAIYDDGSFLTMNGHIINTFKPKIYKASIFTSLTLTGNLRAGSLTSSSDYRIKTDIAELDPTFTVDNLRPVKYLQTLINKTRYGVIAHELQLYYPDLVVGEKDGEELQNVNYTGLIAILINEIKRLKQEVLELENEV